MFNPIYQSDFKGHEDNIKFLQSQANRLDASILDLQGLGKHQSRTPHEAVNGSAATISSENDMMEQILQQQKTAAGVLCQVKDRHATKVSNLSLIKDEVGIVANLATVDNSNLARLLSEFLGPETMMGIVCKTLGGVKALEKYDGGKINESAGIHGLGSTIGREIQSRFLVICLDDLRPYVGAFIAKDPQMKLALPKPKLSDGKCPSGFLDFAVNMINLDKKGLYFVTNSGHGLRETLFYNLFYQLQVYNTRTEMLQALPCITHGALSLDGAMITKNGAFALGNREDVEVKFPVVSGTSYSPGNYPQTEDRIKLLKWECLKIAEDIRREQVLLRKKKKQKQKSAS